MRETPFVARVRSGLSREGEVLLAFLCSRLLIWALAWLAFHSLRHGKYGFAPGDELWNLLFRWDSNWYRAIAETGYSYVPGQETKVAFFPVYPACLWVVSTVTGAEAPLAGFLLSNAFLLSAVLLLHRLVLLDFPAPSRVPARTVWLFLLGPVTFFHSAVYSESLFLFLSLAAIFAARKRHWALAGLAGALLSASRANGIIILVPLFWEALVDVWHNPGPRVPAIIRSCGWLLLVPLGLVAYCAYLHFRFGDALAFAHAQTAWGRGLTTPWRAAAHAWVSYPGTWARLFLATEVVALAALFIGFRIKLRLSYQLYAGAMLLMLISNTLLESLPRYVSVLFPLQMSLAAATARSEGLYLTLLAASAGLMTLCLALYTGGYWFT